MTSLLSDVVAGVGAELAAATSLAALSVAAVVLRDCRKRRHPDHGADADADAKKPRIPAHAADAETLHIPSLGPHELVVAQLQRLAHADSAATKDRIVYTFLDDAGRESVNLTFADVDHAARRVAAALQQHTHADGARFQRGDRVVLCYPPGLDFALAFWGCLYAGAIAIPVYPPYPGTLAKDLPKFNRLVADAGARVILTNRTYHLASKMATAKGFFSTGSAASTRWPEHARWLTTDALAESLVAQYDATQTQALTLQDVAFFQYSSGSTSAPKAVMISHGNLRAQLQTWASIVPSDTLVSWLPSYHDMGLVGFILTPVVLGARCVSMSPISFIKDPPLWLRVASQYRATHICAPNFGYALAARKTSHKAAQQLDLSSLKQAICAAEPIRAASLAAFTATFAPSAGFDPRTFNCGYGLAEVTLVCTGQDPRQRREPTVLHLDKRVLEAEKRVVEVAAPEKEEEDANGVMTLVGCGRAMPTFTVVVVDAETRRAVADGCVGEVWIRGPSVAMGYWQREDYTREMFGATLATDGSKAETQAKTQGQVQGQAQGQAESPTKKKKKKSKGKKKATEPETVTETPTQTQTETYLRTGDMGFLRDGELFVTGRLKDLIIIRGRNVSPQDVEASVEHAHADVRPGCVAAFSVEKDQEEALVVVAEVRPGKHEASALGAICRAISTRVLSEHQLRCQSIVLLRQKTIPKTTSGKIQRSAAKALFQAQSLPKPLHEFTSKDRSPVPDPVRQPQPLRQPHPSQTGQPGTPPVVVAGPVKTEEEILAWLMTRLEHEVEAEAGESSSEGSPSAPRVALNPTTPWAEYGLDSVAIVGLSAELGEFLGCVVPPSAFFQFETPALLVAAPGLATGELEVATTEGTGPDSVTATALQARSLDEIDASCFEIEAFPEVRGLFAQMQQFVDAGLNVPFLETLTDEKRRMINFNTYNYLGNASNQEVAQASHDAITAYGTTMSSSPIVGQTQIAVDLEAELCSFFRAEAAILFVGGWVANVTTLDALVGKGDLILCDALNHDSCVTGQRLSGATILPFPHNDTAALERMLASIRTRYRRVLIVIEGVYSMDGDAADLKEMVRIKYQYKCLLFLDEAHSFGTMGKTGRGLCEHCGVDPRHVDVRMGTMSKALGSVGGFILGNASLVKYLKHSAGGFVFSVGLSPAHCAAALQSLRLMGKSASRTAKLQEHSAMFYDLCQTARIPMSKATERGAPVVVAVTGSTIDTARASQFLALKGQVNVKPIVYPAVEEGKCRLRFFLSALHTPKQLEHTVNVLAEYLRDPQAAWRAIAPEEEKEKEVVTVAVEEVVTTSTTTQGEGEGAKKKKKKKKKTAAKAEEPHAHHHNHNNGNRHSHSRN